LEPFFFENSKLVLATWVPCIPGQPEVAQERGGVDQKFVADGAREVD